MLYLEDYLEMIEHLPQELRDRFTEMREMDLAVQNNTDALDKRVRALFQQCRRAEISSPMADVEFDSIRTNYYRVLDDSDEKIQLAGQMYDLVERYLRRLDTELDKFKCELEADHNGITEILEKRSLELDSMTSNGGANQKENRFYDTQNAHPAGHSGRSDGGSGRYKVKAEKRRDSVAPGMSMGAAAASVEKRSAAGTSKPLNNSALRPNTPAVLAAGGLGVPGAVAAGAAAGGAAGPMVVGGVPGAIGAIATGGVVGAAGAGALATVPCPQPVPVLGGAAGPGAGGVAAATYNLQTCGAGNAIVAAASQAIAQTQQMQQGRRTASLKASYEAIGGVGSHELLLNSELAGATHNALQAVERESTAFSNQRRQKKKSVNALGCGNLRTNPTMLVNASNVTSMLSSSSPNVQTLSSSPSLSSVSVHVHTSPLQQQQQQQQNQQQSPQFAAQQQQQPQQQHQSTVQSQQLLIHANTPVSLQHGQLQPVMQQLTLPSIPGMKQLLPGQQQQLLNQQKPVQLVSAQHRMPRQLQPQQLQQSLQAQHLQQQQHQLQRPQLLQQQAQQLHTVPHQQLLQAQSQQKQQLQQQLKSVQQHATFQQAQQQQQVQSQLVQQQQQQVVQHMQQLPVQQQLLDHKDIQLQSSQQLLQQQQQQQPQQVFQQQRQLLLQQQQQQLQQQPQLQAAQQQLLQLQNKQHGAAGQQAVQVLPQSLHQQQPFMTSVAQTSSSNATVVNVSSFMDTLMTNSVSTGATAGTSGTSSSSTTTTAAAAAAEPTASVDQAPEGEWFDPNEPRYCLCNQVSYGDMVACDNEDCPFEWFHYPCVNISSSPKGKWYCPQCSSSMKRRASRKN
ncbi:polyhomeotic-proximal chromatin protein-like isoform X1 [Anopheles arabiensis]|uniref:Inhibitor of growth protein n=1 Tax=Anopheles arabiensis TaxID=7173 RepID=A0A182IA23_ANOAR|nr:polyhomeotic-proximal chromatin protein-like isoform X1 [Anopheles arabiensis]